MRRILVRVSQPLEAAVVLIFHGLLGLLSPSAGSKAGGWLMRRIGPLLKAHRVARSNLERAFPGIAPPRLAELLDGIWDNLGRNIGEFPHLRSLLEDPRSVELHGEEILDALHQTGKPAIFVGAHLANWRSSRSLRCAGECRLTWCTGRPTTPGSTGWWLGAASIRRAR